MNLGSRFIVERPDGREVKLRKINFYRYISATRFGLEWADRRAKQLRDALVNKHQYVVRLDYKSKRKPAGANKGLEIKRTAGFRLVTEVREDGKLVKACIVCDYKDELGRPKIKSFAIRKYGYVGAFGGSPRLARTLCSPYGCRGRTHAQAYS